MNHQVLLADDSITIQKVIKITLANQPYDITDCSSEDELFQKLPVIQPKIVFLDFNLSENHTGYELCSKIHAIVPSTKILLLLGTFDTIDDNAMEKCGASDKVVKPFDSNKFIAICRQLIESFDDSEELSYPEEKKPVQSPLLVADGPEDQWQMSHATDPFIQVKESVKAEAPVSQSLNPLAQEINDWGMSIPSVIGNDSSSRAELPPVIGTVSAEIESPAPVKAPEVLAISKFPANDDLDYPSMGATDFNQDETPQNIKKPKLVPIETLNQEALGLELEGNYVENKTDIGSLEAQIHDEVADNLWHADEFEDLKQKVSSKIDEMKSGFQPSRNDFDESLFKPAENSDSIIWNEVNSDIFAKPKFEPTVTSTQIASTEEILEKIRPELEDMVRNHVKDYMDEMFRKNVEKVSWEVIPDLAENLIRQELSKISEKILNQTR